MLLILQQLIQSYFTKKKAISPALVIPPLKV